MRIPPRDRRLPAHAFRDRAFTVDSGLEGMIRRMISTNALAAFTSQVAQTRPTQPVRGVNPTPNGPAAEAQPTQRTLEAVPAAPGRPLPRGSLLDLRV
ncbi:hypothetical protein [Belnapia rosea]|nr:hypothetical protein [Belnapia rosea]